MTRDEQEDPDGRLAFVLLRYLMGWDQGELAREARIASSQVSVYDRGERPVPREVLERAADAADFPRYLLDPVLRTIRSFRAAAKGRSRAERVWGEAFLAELIDLRRLAMDAVLCVAPEQPAVQPPSADDREAAADLWAKMERRTAKQRRALVEETEEFRSWALCERVAAASREAVISDPRHALELAELALLIAELTPGEEAWRSRLQGYAGAHLSKARRASGDPSGAEGAMARAKKLWAAGATGDPGLLDETARREWRSWADE